jgi:hypothetical protein
MTVAVQGSGRRGATLARPLDDRKNACFINGLNA